VVQGENSTQVKDVVLEVAVDVGRVCDLDLDVHSDLRATQGQSPWQGAGYDSAWSQRKLCVLNAANHQADRGYHLKPTQAGLNLGVFGHKKTRGHQKISFLLQTLVTFENKQFYDGAKEVKPNTRTLNEFGRNEWPPKKLIFASGLLDKSVTQRSLGWKSYFTTQVLHSRTFQESFTTEF
jgi:hypothetical protein